MKLSIISSTYNPAPDANVELIITPNKAITETTFLRDQPVLSITADDTASTNDTQDVNPAKTKQVKNKQPSIVPHTPITENTLGKTINASPIPLETTSSIPTP